MVMPITDQIYFRAMAFAREQEVFRNERAEEAQIVDNLEYHFEYEAGAPGRTNRVNIFLTNYASRELSKEKAPVLRIEGKGPKWECLVHRKFDERISTQRSVLVKLFESHQAKRDARRMQEDYKGLSPREIKKIQANRSAQRVAKAKESKKLPLFANTGPQT
jgi:hypothetical protein